MSHGFGAALKVDDGKPRLPGSLHLNRRLSQWLHLRADGVVEVKPGKVELGQGILTTLAQIAADELDVALERIRMVSVVTPESPDEAVTSGSLSVQDSGSAIRHASADARRIFLSVAAQRSGVAFEAITVQDGDFIGPCSARIQQLTQALIFARQRLHAQRLRLK
jgi:CO/xanthine dehydrogenase Mo-binding subunit